MLNKVIEFICEYQNVDREMLSENTQLVNDIGLSSMDLIEMCAVFEDIYEIEIPTTAIYELKTIKDVVLYLEDHVDSAVLVRGIRV